VLTISLIVVMLEGYFFCVEAMPVYEYQCQQCGVFEATQKITERPLQRCPSCKGKVKRLISNTSFQLKGSGWYLTDYARKNSAPKEEKAVVL
jgi:putative FmdB family regulatory protein